MKTLKAFIAIMAIVVVGLAFASFDYEEVDLSKAPECPPGYRVRSHVGSGTARFYTFLGITWDNLSFVIPDGKWRAVEVMNRYSDPANGKIAANANVIQFLRANQSFIGEKFKEKRRLTFRGRPAVQTRFFYLWGTVYEKIEPGRDDKFMVQMFYWDDDDEEWTFSRYEFGEYRRIGYGRMRMEYNSLDYNECPVTVE